MIKINRYSYPSINYNTEQDDFEIFEFEYFDLSVNSAEFIGLTILNQLKTKFLKPKIEILSLENPNDKKKNKVFVLLGDEKQKQLAEEYSNKQDYDFGMIFFDVINKQSSQIYSSRNKNSIAEYLTLFHNLVFDYFGKDINIKVKAAIYKNKLVAFELIPTGKGVNDDIVFLAKNISNGILSYIDGLKIEDKFTFMRNYFES